ncbi:hypothetical protein RRF57_010095 [Xylaria bambusicola]|uniref:Uncharacterized protein n=1 Tax=Xylaria bambusicola TaxID=326684 RepID=A0AAN7UWQ9_9PEZI
MSTPVKSRQSAEPTTPAAGSPEETSVIRLQEPRGEVLLSPPRTTVVRLHGPHYLMPPMPNSGRVERHLPALRALDEIHNRRVHYETILRDQRRGRYFRRLRLRRDRLLLFRELHARLRLLEEETIEWFHHRWGLQVEVARSEEELHRARRRAARRAARQEQQEERDWEEMQDTLWRWLEESEFQSSLADTRKVESNVVTNISLDNGA